MRKAKPTIIVNLDDFTDKLIKKAIKPITQRQYDRALAKFDEFLEHHPEATSPPDLRTYKAFLVVVASTAQGRLKETPTPDSIDGFRRQFEAAWERDRNYKFPKSITTTMKEWIPTELKDMIPLSTGEMSVDALSPVNLAATITHLWCHDSFEYRGDCPERSRVQLSFAALLYCFSSARTGEVHESTARKESAIAATACYKHFKLYLQLIDDEMMLVMYYERAFTKGKNLKKRWQIPIHGFYEKYKKDTVLLLNPLVFFLPMAFADGAIRSYASLDELLNDMANGLPDDTVVFPIHTKSEVADLPLFRPYNEQLATTSTGAARGADAFGKQFAELGHRAGFESNVTVRACRRWALMQADDLYSETARMKFAGQESRTIFGTNYAHPVCQVDGQATYLGIEPRVDHIKHGRTLQLQRHPQLLQKLPARLEMEFQQREDIIDLKKRSNTLKLQMKTASEDEKPQIQTERRSISNEISRLYNIELKSQRQQQPLTLRSSKEDRSSFNAHERTFFQYSRQVMPERNLLADVLPRKVELRSAEGRDALHALESMCREHSLVAYRRSFMPIEGRCICGEKMESFGLHRRWLHIYKCYQREYKLLSKTRFAELCLSCDSWFRSKHEWQDHCLMHLNTPGLLPLRCDLLIFRNVPIHAGFCLFCLNNSSLSAERRMEQYLTNKSEWVEEMESHLIKLEKTNSACKCPDPVCSIVYDSIEELRFHLQDVHCYNRSNYIKSKKRDFAELETASDSKTPIPPTDNKTPSLKIIKFQPSSLPSKKRCIDPQLLGKPEESICPICSTVIDRQLLRKYTNKRRYLSFKAQSEICHAHRQITAENQRRKCGYPIVDWDAIENRLDQLSPMIFSIIKAGKKSFFEASIEDNRQKLVRGSNFHGAGYYGPKGLDIIGQYIAGAHGSYITASSVEKTGFIKRCGGVPAYIQEVLVPEVVTKLIAEDMNVSDCQARSVLQKSKEIGEILNEME